MAIQYDVGAKIDLTGNLSAGLAGLGRDLDRLSGKIDAAGNRFSGWHDTLKLIGTYLAAETILHGVEKIFEATAKLSHEWSQIQKMGLDTGQLVAAQAAVLDASRIKGMTERSAAEVYGGNVSVLRPEEAASTLPFFSKFFLASKANDPNHDEQRALKTTQEATRAAEILGYLKVNPKTGQVDEERLKHFLDLIQKINLATHGQVGPSQVLAIAKTGATGMRTMSEEGLLGTAIAAQHLGADRAGTAIQSLYQQLIGGTMFSRNAKALQEMGILRQGDWTTDHGRVVMTQRGSKHVQEFLGDDPLAFAERYLKKLSEHGITSRDDIQKEIFRDFGRGTTQRLISDIVANLPSMLAEREQAKKAQGVEGAINTANEKDIEQNLSNLAAAFTNLETAIGKAQTENVIRVLSELTSDVQLLADASNKLGSGDMQGFYKALSDLSSVDTKNIKQVTDAILQLYHVFEILSGGGGKEAPGIQLHDWLKDRGVDLDAKGWWEKYGPKSYDPTQETKPPVTTPESGGHWWERLMPKSWGSESKEAPVIVQPPPKQETKVERNVTTINLDGTQLASLIEDRIAQMHELPDSATSSNGVAYSNLNDWNPKSR